MKRVDQGVYQMVAMLAEANLVDFPGGGVFLLDAAMDGVGLAPPHESDVDESVWEKTNALNEMLIAGEINTGVDVVSGDLMDEEEDED